MSDDTGGINQEDISALFRPGGSIESPAGWSIGGYALGAKKAIPRLGGLHRDDFDYAEIKSRRVRKPTGHGFRIASEWFTRSEWEFNKQEYTDVEEGHTKIVVKSNAEIWTEDVIEDLKEELARTYHKFLNGEAADQSGSVTLIVNGEKLQYSKDIDWTFIPIDGLFPRRYTGFTLGEDLDDLSAPIKLTLTVGLMRHQDQEIAGTDVYCQDRLITLGNQEEPGGYGRGENKIGNFTGHKARLKVLVELRTKGAASDLPWDTQKQGIDLDSRITRALHEKLSRWVRPYFVADADNVPEHVASVFGSDHPHAANNGEIKEIDVNAIYVNPRYRPEKPLERIPEIWDNARIDANSGYLIEKEDSDFEHKGEYEAYKQLVQNYVDNTETLETVSASIAEEERDSVNELRKRLKSESGIGDKTVQRIIDSGIQTVEELQSSSQSDLESIDSVGPSTAETILDLVRDGYKESDDSKAETNNPDDPAGAEQDDDQADHKASEVDDSEGTIQANNGETEQEKNDTVSPEGSENTDRELQTSDNSDEEKDMQGRSRGGSRVSAQPRYQSNSQMSTEEIAMQCVREYEKEQGRKPRDVSNVRPSRGFDIESKDPETGQPVRYIESKGRSSTGYVELTDNEWKTANEYPDKYWVYIVANTESNPVLYALPASELSTEKINVPRFRIPEDEWRSSVKERKSMD